MAKSTDTDGKSVDARTPWKIDFQVFYETLIWAIGEGKTIHELKAEIEKKTIKDNKGTDIKPISLSQIRTRIATVKRKTKVSIKLRRAEPSPSEKAAAQDKIIEDNQKAFNDALAKAAATWDK